LPELFKDGVGDFDWWSQNSL